jgi:hypothetical protein
VRMPAPRTRRPVPRRAPGRGRRVPSALATAILAALVAACGSSTLFPSASTAGPSGTASAGPSVAATPLPGGLPADACTVVTAGDVVAAFGGSVSTATPSAAGTCRFEITGAMKAGQPGPGPALIAVGFTTTYTPFADVQGLFGDAVSKIDSLGSEAWYGLRAVHVKVPGGELVVSGAYLGVFDAATLRQSTIDLAKSVAARLGSSAPG